MATYEKYLSTHHFTTPSQSKARPVIKDVAKWEEGKRVRLGDIGGGFGSSFGSGVAEPSKRKR